MNRVSAFFAFIILPGILVSVVSGADLYVPEGATVTISTNQTYGKIDVDGTLVVESSAEVIVTGSSGKSGVRGCCGEIIINGGSLDVDSRFDTDGGAELGAKITMNGGFFEADDFKLPDSEGPVTITLNGGILHAVTHQPYLDRNFKVIIGGGVYRVDGDVEGTGDQDPRTWLSYNPPALVPAAGYSVDDIVIEYVAGGNYTEIRADATARVQFETSSSSAFENVSPAELTVNLTNGEGGQTYTVDYSVTGGTAIGGGTDYTLTPGPLTFNPGDTSKTINITIEDDGSDEDDETIEVTLTGVSGGSGVLGQNVQHTYTIIDPRPKVAFETASSMGLEDVSPVEIEVGLSWMASGTVTVDYAATGGSATGEGVDYTLLGSGTLTFVPDDMSETISISIVDDELEEESETIVITLWNLTGDARLGDCTEHTYTIFEDAFPSFADVDTVGLWLFDEVDYPHTTLTDASRCEKADLCLMDGGSMIAGKYGRALQVGSGYAVCYAGFAGKVPEEELREEDGTPSGLWGPTEGSGPLLNGLAGSTWTMELWLNLSSSGSDICVIDLGWAYDPGVSLVLNGNSLELTNYYAGVQLTCPTSLSTGVWQHVAFTYDGATGRHFVDGIEQGTATVGSVAVQAVPDLQVPLDREHESRGFENMTYEQRRQNRFNFAVGTDRYAVRALDGMVDEMRISDVVRYTGNFTPESFSRNYGAGALPPSVANGLPLLYDSGPVSIPLLVGGRKHVFIDDMIIDTMSGLQITMNQPYGKEEIVKDFTIEKSAWRPSVLDVNGFVYLAMPEGYSGSTGTTYLATSPDGLNFTMKDPIIVDAPLYGSFFKDLNPNIHPEEQYKVNAFVGNRGMYMYVSPDGMNWRRNETCQLALRSGGEGECFWDDQRGRYASYLKRDSSFDDDECPDASGRVAVGFWADEILKGWPFNHLVTPYFEGYPFPSVTCEGPVEFDSTAAGEVYRTRAIKYPWAPDVYLAFLWRYPGDDGPRHVDLGVSRDGENWSFFGTSWYIPFGSSEEELSMYGLIRRGDEIWQYVDEGGAHGGDAPRYYYRYKQRLDGFVSLDAGGTTGTAMTLPMIFCGEELTLNVAAAGSVKVGILDQRGTPIPGFTISDCDAMSGDFVEQLVTWNGSSDVSALAGSSVRLQFEMLNSKLYALQFRRFGDLDDDGDIDYLDMKVFGSNWLWSGTPGTNDSDLDEDGRVDFADFALLAARWPESCP